MTKYGGRGPLSFSIDWYRRRIFVFDGGGGGGCPLGVRVRNWRGQSVSRVARLVGAVDDVPVDLGDLFFQRRGLGGQDGCHRFFLGGRRPLDRGAGGWPLSHVFG